MSKSAILSSSIAKKWWMALTGLFLCLFLVGHLLGNIQLLFPGEEGRVTFNEYAYFMTHNPVVKILSWITYFSILFHSVDGLLLTIQNKKARPQKYAYNKPSANTSTPSRYMGVLGSAILIFIVIHMANFWWPMKMSGEPMPLHSVTKTIEQPVGMDPSTNEMITQELEVNYYLTTKGNYEAYSYKESPESETTALERVEIRNNTELYNTEADIKIGEVYKDLHSQVLSFFGQDKSSAGFPENKNAVVAVVLYVLSMLVLSFHLWHGFASSFQSLGLNSKKYTPMIKLFGKAYAVLIPLGFAIIPVLIFMNK